MNNLNAIIIQFFMILFNIWKVDKILALFSIKIDETIEFVVRHRLFVIEMWMFDVTIVENDKIFDVFTNVAVKKITITTITIRIEDMWMINSNSMMIIMIFAVLLWQKFEISILTKQFLIKHVMTSIATSQSFLRSFVVKSFHSLVMFEITMLNTTARFDTMTSISMSLKMCVAFVIATWTVFRIWLDKILKISKTLMN